MGKRKTIRIEDYRSSCMASKARKRNQSNSLLVDESIQQPSNMFAETRVGGRVYGGVLPNQHTNSQHNELTQQNNTSITNETNEIQNTQSNESSRQPPFLKHAHMVGNQARNSQHEESRQQNTYEISNGSIDVENAESGGGEIDQKVRGPTHMLKIWGRPSYLPLIMVEFDHYGRPIGTNKSTFIEFLGTIARNGVYCPIDVESWHKMSKENKKDMLNAVKAKFDITGADEKWILHSINEKWRSWKSFVKARCFWPNKTVEFLMDEREERVMEDQWVNMVKYWNREDVQAQSKKNKDARSKKKMDHRTGKKSFAQVNEKMKKEKGRAPFRSEMFEVCYTPANGSPSIDVTKYLDSMKELKNQLPEGSHDSVGPDDIFAQVTGKDKPGYFRMFGGVPASDVWGEVPTRNTYKRKMLEQESQISEMKNQMAELQSQILSQQRLILQQPQMSAPLPERLPGLVTTKQSLRVGGSVILKSVIDSTKIVAKGCLHSTDPNAQVGGQALGENWCQVHVQVVLEPGEQLIRPYDYYHILEDVHGGMVAWPCSLVAPTESRSKV